MQAAHGESGSYQDLAQYYDTIMGDRRPYFDFYISLVRDSDRALLDIGCGSGAVTLELAKAIWRNAGGRLTRIVGVDGSSAMLEEARRRDSRIEWILGDLRRPPVTGHFDLIICTYNTLQHVDRHGLAEALGGMLALLSPQGRIAFDIYRPNLDYIRIPQRNRLAFRVTDDTGRPLEVREDTDFDEAAGVLTIDWRLSDPSGPSGDTLSHARYNMWQHDPADVEKVVADQGLAIAERYGGLDRSTFGPSSKKQVIVCTAA